MSTDRARPGMEPSGDSGFTLLELLISAAMIGILATLAIANYAMFKQSAFNTAAATDARNLAAPAEMAASEPDQPSLIVLAGTGGQIAELPGANSSPDTFGTIEIVEGGYRIVTFHRGGNVCYTLTSSVGMTATPGSCAP